MTAFEIPSEVLLALVLLPGYLSFRVGLFAARSTLPEGWSEFERTAISVVGGLSLVGLSAYLTPVLRFFSIDPSFRLVQREGDLLLSTQMSLGDYSALLLVSLVLGGLTGSLWTMFYNVRYGLVLSRDDPIRYLLKRLRTPVQVRIVTGEGADLWGKAYHSDAESNPVVVQSPEVVSTVDGEERRRALGEFAYVDPGDIERIYFGSTVKEQTGRIAALTESLTAHLDRFREEEAPTAPKRTRSEVTSVSQNGRRISVRGTVSNDYERTLAFVLVNVRFLNAEGQLVGSESTTIEDLQANERRPFEVLHRADDPSAIANRELHVTPYVV
jgi:fumarate reductase subunit C